MASKQVAEIKKIVKVENFNNNLFNVGDCKKFLFSIFPDMSPIICKFTILVYPRGNSADNSEYVSLYFGGILTHMLSVLCTLSILDVDKHLVLFQSFENNGNKINFGLDRFVLRKTLFERQYELLPDNALTICCEITYYYKIPKLPTWDERGQEALEFRFFYVLSLHAFSDCVESEIYFLQGNDDGTVVPVKKSILSHHSPVFARMLISDMVEKKQDCVKIQDINRWTLLRLIYFFISKEIVFTCTDDLYDLYIVADKYAIESLLCECRKHLKKNIHYENVCYLFMFSAFHNDHLLKTFALSHILSYFNEVSNTAEWKYMVKNHPHVVQGIVSCKNDSDLLNNNLVKDAVHVLEDDIEEITEKLNDFDFYQ